MHDDELLDLVNKEDEIIGTIWRNDTSDNRLANEKLGYIRAVELFIVNSKGELWIPKRTAHKRIAPNGLDFSAAGHVSSGETYIEAMIKEAREELSLDLSEEDLKFVAKIGPDENCYIREQYVYRTNKTPTFNRDDFVSAAWLQPEELLKQLDSGIPAKSSLRFAVAITRDWLAAN